MVSVEEELARRIRRGEEVVLATVIGTGGSPPSRAGAKLLLSRSGLLSGTLGCSELDAAALAEAPRALDGAAPHVSRYAHDLGTVDVYLEPHAERPTLVVAGATPVAASILEGAGTVGFRSVLVETRAERRRGRDWPADEVVESLDTLPATLPEGGALFGVVTDHDSPDVVAVCAALLARGPRFLGVMGSRRHSSPRLEELRALGVPTAQVAAIRSPVGLDLGARTPEEIALSILAGLVAVRRGGRGGWLDPGRAGGGH